MESEARRARPAEFETHRVWALVWMIRFEGLLERP